MLLLKSSSKYLTTKIPPYHETGLTSNMESNTASVSTTAHCGICSELYTDPRMLSCLHSFCCKCLQKNMENKESFKCPTCEKEASIPEGGVLALPKDLRKGYEAQRSRYEMKLSSQSGAGNCERCMKRSGNTATSFCCECCEFLCEACSEDHKWWRKTSSHELVSVGEKKVAQNVKFEIKHEAINCQRHTDQIVKFYCETCKTLICRDCVVKKHAGHEYDDIIDIAEKEKADLLTSIASTAETKSKLSDALALGDKVMQQVQAKQKSVEEDIKRSFNEIRQALCNREEALLARAAEIGVGKLAALRMQGEELKAMLDELDKTSEMASTATQAYTPTEMLSVKGVMSTKLKQLFEQFESTLLNPCKSDIIQSELNTASVLKNINKYGAVYDGCYPANSRLLDISIPRAVVGKKREIQISTFDANDNRYPFGGERVIAELKQVGSKDPPLVANVVDNKDGTYSASLTPQVCGAHELSVTIETEPIRGSPFPLYIRQPRDYANMTKQQRCFNTASDPYDVAVDDKGFLYVALYSQHCIDVLDQQGTVIRTIGTRGSSGRGNGQFIYPNGVAVQGDVLYVADYNNHRVQKLTTSGEFLLKFGTQGSGDGQLNIPRGICVDARGRIFVSEYNNKRVSVFEPCATFAYHITHNTISNPWGMAFDLVGNLHVVDHTNNTVSIFTPEGKYISQYNSQVQNPSDIAIDEEGYKFVGESYSDYGSSRLSILGPENNLVHTIQGFNQVFGVAMDKDGYVYVSSYSTNQVLKY